MRQYKARLVFRDEDEPPIIIDIDDEIIIKRSLEQYSVVCDTGMECFSLEMFDPSVSSGKGHARLFWEGHDLYIQDLGSSNGTYLIRSNKEIPLKGWSPGSGDSAPNPSEKIRITKSERILVGSMEFSIELEQFQKINIRGDYISEGASKVTISDSVIQRSNIGGGATSSGNTSINDTALQRSKLTAGGNISVEDSVIVRSKIGNTTDQCPNCRNPVKQDWMMCPKCGNKLRDF